MRNPSASEEAALVVAAQQHLQGRAMAAESVQALGFTMANESVALAHYRQAAVLLVDASGKLALRTASGLALVSGDSPFAVWLERWAQATNREPGAHRIGIADAPEALVEGWSEWLPDHVLICPMHAPDGHHLGTAIYARDDLWTDAEAQAMAALHAVYGYCLWALQAREGLTTRLWKKLRAKARWPWVLLGVLLLLCVPVRQSVLAPAEVAAITSHAVSSPQEGVIGQIAVQPNQTVKSGDLLFSLDMSSLRSRQEVARQALAIAKADYLVAQQRAFEDPRSRADLAAAAGKVREKEAELQAIDLQADRVEVRATQDGVVVFSDANDWIGRSVQVGERVMLLADPGTPALNIWVPVRDAVAMEKGTPVRMFLHTRPLQPVRGTIEGSSYQAGMSPDGVVAFRLRALLEPGQELPHLGLRGTARITGEWAPLGMYLFRRPLATLRIWTGL